MPLPTGLVFSTVTGPEQHHTVRIQRQESREHRSAEAERNTKHWATPTLGATAGVECGLSGAEIRGSAEESLLLAIREWKGAEEWRESDGFTSG